MNFKTCLAPIFIAAVIEAICVSAGYSQFEPVATQKSDEKASLPGERSAVPQSVDIAPNASDRDIAQRLERILSATGWFHDPEVRVDQGVVFIAGTAQDRDAKDWATELVQRTQGAVAVVNQLRVDQPALWDLSPAWQGLRQLWHDAIAKLPFLLFGVVVLLIAWAAARLGAAGVRMGLERQVPSPLLRNVLANAFGLLLLLLGVYIVLRVSGLTRLALTVIGGTGIFGLVVGIAFRDITENFLASVFLSMRRPFMTGDLVEIVDVLGYVQRLTTRATVLMTLNGNHVEIPNSIVYKNKICNFSTNKNRREDFTVGIGYDVSITDAQETALAVLRDHPAVLRHPEPWALVDSLGSAVVVLKIYFWLDGAQHSWLKVKSSVIRHVKRAFQNSGISMPDEAREIVFPQGVPVQLLQSQASEKAQPKSQCAAGQATATGERPAEPASTAAEGKLTAEAEEIEDQARHSRVLDDQNLLNAHSSIP